MGCSKISKILILGAKFAEKFTISYKQTKTYFNKNVHLISILKYEGQVKRGHQGEWLNLWGGVQVVEYQVKSTSINEQLWYITVLTMKCAILKTTHDGIKDKVKFVNFCFIFDECLDEFLGEFFT